MLLLKFVLLSSNYNAKIIIKMINLIFGLKIDFECWKCIFSRKLKIWNWVFPTTSSYSYVPAHNCMNKWLGEPVPGFQLPGRGILRNFINKVVIWNTLIILMAKQKTTDDFTCRFIFLIGKTKNLQVKKFVKMNLVKVHSQ